MKVSDGSPTCAWFSEQALSRAARHKARAARDKACVISGESVERGGTPLRPVRDAGRVQG